MEIKAYPRIKNAILLCLLWTGIQLGLGIIIGLVIVLFGLGTDSVFYGIAIILAQLISVCVVILIGFKKTKQKFNEVFKFNTVSYDLWIAVIVFMLGFIILSSELDTILIYFLPMPQFLQNTFEIMMVRQTFVISIIMVGIIPAFTEEMFFRGIILNGLKENYSEKRAIIVSALLFGFIHLNPWQFVSAFIIGLFSAFICLRTRSILLSIYMHFFNNMVGIIALKYNNTAYSERVFQPIWFDLIGIVITILGIILLRNCMKKLGKAKNCA